MKKEEVSTATPVAPFQPSPGVLKETTIDKYITCQEDIAEVAIAAIQPGWGSTAPIQLELDPGIGRQAGGVEIQGQIQLPDALLWVAAVE